MKTFKEFLQEGFPKGVWLPSHAHKTEFENTIRSHPILSKHFGQKDVIDDNNGLGLKMHHNDNSKLDYIRHYGTAHGHNVFIKGNNFSGEGNHKTMKGAVDAALSNYRNSVNRHVKSIESEKL